MRNCERGNKITVGIVVNSKVGELEEDISEVFSRGSKKKMTSVVQ